VSQKDLIDACTLSRLGYYDFWVAFMFFNESSQDERRIERKTALTTALLSMPDEIPVKEAFSNLDRRMLFI
jgi:hypothetical protein